MMMRMKNILLLGSVLFFFLSAGLASASIPCSNPNIYINANPNINGGIGFPITNCGTYGEKCTFYVSSSDTQSPITNYTLAAQNVNSVPEMVFIQPSPDLADYASNVTVVVPSQSIVFFNMPFWTGDDTQSGSSDNIIVNWDCGSGQSPNPIVIPLIINGNNNTGRPMTPMQSLFYNSGISITTTTTTTAPVTLPIGGTVVFDQQGCTYSQILCPSTYFSCLYLFTRNGAIFPPTISCDAFNTEPNPGSLNSGQSLCPWYDNGGFANTIRCTVAGYGDPNNPTTTSTSTITTTSTTSSTTTSTTTTTTPITSTTTPSGSAKSLLDSFGCNYGSLVCPSNYFSCTYQLTRNGANYPSTISCDAFNTKANPGSLNSGQSLCPWYDNGGFANTIRCQLFGYSGTSTTSTTSTTTSSTTSTTTTAISTTTTTAATSPPSGGTIILNTYGCNLQQIQCPSNYKFCTYLFARNNMAYPSVISCDAFNTKANPGNLNSGQSLCPSYDTNGFGNTINCIVVGYGTADSSSIVNSFSQQINSIINSVTQAFISFLQNVH